MLYMTWLGRGFAAGTSRILSVSALCQSVVTTLESRSGGGRWMATFSATSFGN